ncbi:Hypothetical predicted protein [Mytilus galloprovincialis]|uniref:Uncharacterized protein n=1 Tax=Mytilus galloprovincialis TaxID=29158 RepID=A0A8B6EDV7_MYTGA|nr:Hypothetical predicted protein [Mytilus galloprovincialis]
MEEIFRKMPQYENDLSKVVQEIKDISIKFEATDIISNTVSFGHLHSTEQRPPLPGLKTVNFQTGKLKVLFTIDVKSNYNSGIFFNDDIVITDWDQKSVIFHDNTGKQTGVLSVQNDPTDITKVNDQTVAVSSDAQKFFIINVNPLNLIKTLDISVPVWDYVW